MIRDKKPTISKIAFIGNYSPRRCGIATFTSDLCENYALKYPNSYCYAVPVTDIPEGYDYPDRVRFEIIEQDLDSYKRAADFININSTDVVSLQHEYGIFGGPAGSYILSLLRNLNTPIITTLHTVLREPSKQQIRVLSEIAELSKFLVVMTSQGEQLLKSAFAVDEKKIRIIPHGIPDVSFIDPSFYKDQYGVEGKMVLLTFGLLSPNKGIEIVLQALPAIVKQFPNVVYIILGQTHPNLLKEQGESYRLRLQRIAEELGVEKHVLFYNRFVTLEELKEFIVTADIYITPYLNEEQVVSGTLAYSFGAGNAIVSTPFWHAAELLADNKGILVPFKNPDAISDAVLHLLINESDRHQMRKNAYLLGRDMVWSKTAEHYNDVFVEARIRRLASSGRKVSIQPLNTWARELPTINLGHIKQLTDSTGILQHSTYNVPNFNEGYCTDDNARALILMVFLEEMKAAPNEDVHRLKSIYLSFLLYAFNAKTMRFRNFLSYNRQWSEGIGSEDSHARALWALGTCIGRVANSGYLQLSAEIFNRALPVVENFTSPRAWAFALLGIHEYFRRFSGDRVANNIRSVLANKLLQLYKSQASEEWPWFEPEVTYCNAKLPHALLMCGQWLENEEMMRTGLSSLDWLLSIQTSSQNKFCCIGADSFYRRNGTVPLYDQQPIEASVTMSACLEAYRITRDQKWYIESWKIFNWFLGKNILGLPLFDPQTGGCCDGLLVDRLNLNQGAESTLAFNLALVEMTALRNELQSLNEPLPLQTEIAKTPC